MLLVLEDWVIYKSPELIDYQSLIFVSRLYDRLEYLTVKQVLPRACPVPERYRA